MCIFVMKLFDINVIKSVQIAMSFMTFEKNCDIFSKLNICKRCI